MGVLLEGLREQKETPKPKAVKPERVWKAVKKRIINHPSTSCDEGDVDDGNRRFVCVVTGDVSRGKVTKALDALMGDYGCSVNSKRSKWEEGRVFTRTYRAGGRHVATGVFREVNPVKGVKTPVWVLTISVPKR